MDIDLNHLDTDTFEGYLRAAKRVQMHMPTWRYGQALFNTLHLLHPEIADYYRGSLLDPFNTVSKAKIDSFLADLYGWFHN